MQTRMAQRTAAYLSHELNTGVSVGGLNISWFLNVVLENVQVKDRKNAVLIKSPKITLDVDKINIKHRSVSIQEITITGAGLKLIKYRSDSTFNYSFLIDYFSSESNTTTDPWKVALKGITIEGSSLVYNNEHKEAVDSIIDYNHLLVSNIYLKADNIAFAGDSISADIKNLAAIEKSGFRLHRLAGSISIKPGLIEATNLKIMTRGSDLQADMQFTYNDSDDLSNFIDSVSIEAMFKPSILELNELKYFAREVNGMENLIHFNGRIKGKISSLKARDFQFRFGANSFFEGEISMDGLPDIQETFIHLKVNKLATDYYDLANIRLPGNQTLKLPKEIMNLGVIDIKGFFTGFIYDFVSSADFITSIGKLETDLSLKTGRGKLLMYNGEFNLKEWDLGQTFNIREKAGKVSLKSTVNGEILNKKHNNIKFDALVEKVMLLNNEFSGITVNGQLINRLFNGNLIMKDELGSLDFKGMVDFTENLPVMNFTATLKDAYLSKLNLLKRDSTTLVSTKMDLNFKGSNIDNMLGYLRFDSTTYTEGSKSYFINTIELATTRIGPKTKKLSLKSDLADASFYGVFSFGDFYNSISNVVSQYLPSLNLSKQKEYNVTEDQLFEYTLQLKDLTPVTELFIPDLKLTSEASIFGNYNSANNTITLNGRAKGFNYKGVSFNNWFARGKNSGASMQFNTGVTSIVFNKESIDDKLNLEIENFIFKAFMQGDTIKYDLGWDDKITENINVGQINGYLSFSDSSKIHSRFENFNLVVNEMPWKANQLNDIIIDSTSIAIDDLELVSRKQKLWLTGKISSNPDDLLTLNFRELDISNADMLINANNVDFDGILTGAILLRDLYNTQKVEAQVEVKDFAFNKERMGDVAIKSVWNHAISALDVNADIIYKGNAGTHLPISAKGLIYTAKREEGNFDLDVKVFNYKLASLNPYLRGIASNIKGFASGNLRMEGTFNKPVITGELDLLRTQLKIDYLNVTYSFADKVVSLPTLISAEDVLVYDSLGNTARLDFKLKHQNFRDITLDIDVTANKISSLYTNYRNNNLFYGNAFATGDVNIQGTLKDVTINIDAKSEPNTNVYIPINLAVSATENSFIKFKTTDDESVTDPVIDYTTESGTDVNINLRVTRDAEVQLFLPENIGNIKGTGTGNIQMGVNKQSELSIYGDYRMNEGSFLFTLGNIINRVFSIENGSTISFNGSPYDADINLSAVYRTKASLRGLPEYSGVSVPVDCIIRLKDNLYNPDISFSIRLPEVNNELSQVIFAAIDTSNQVIMTQQIVSLLVLKTFAFSSSPTLATSVSSSSIEVLTDQLSNMLSQIIKDVDIGVKYRTGDLPTDEEVEVALSTSFFNDRVTVDGNVGMYTSGSAQNANEIVGDVMIDVKITPDGRFRVKAFNRSNQFDIRNEQEDYTQGIGVYYRYEFDKFSDIFQRKKRKPQ